MKPGTKRRLKEIQNKGCTKCSLHRNATNVCVMGDGNYKLPIFVVGEAPGRQEDARGRPFVGMSGKKLRTALMEVGLHPSRLYLTNAVKCFPKKEGNPKPKQARTCSSTYLEEEVRELAPLYVLALGGTALKALTEETSIVKARGKIHPCKFANSPLVFATYHPAYILRRDDLRGQWDRDLLDFKLMVDLDLGQIKTEPKAP